MAQIDLGQALTWLKNRMDEIEDFPTNHDRLKTISITKEQVEQTQYTYITTTIFGDNIEVTVRATREEAL